MLAMIWRLLATRCRTSWSSPDCDQSARRTRIGIIESSREPRVDRDRTGDKCPEACIPGRR